MSRTIIDYTKGDFGQNNYSTKMQPDLTTMNRKPMFNGNTKNKAKLDDLTVIDKDWVNNRFMVQDSDLDPVDANNRYYSTAYDKFTDSSLGGNIGINARPQFTPYCDIHIQGRRSDTTETSINDRKGNFGMGRYYSEALDDNEQTVFFEFGVPKFNSMFDFFTKAIDYRDSVIANTGRKPYGFAFGELVGSMVMLAAFPLVTIAVWGLKKAIGLVTGHGAFNYYYLDPTMHTYWGTVNTIVTQISTELGILAPLALDSNTSAQKIGVNVKINKEDLDAMRKLMPNLLSKDNYIDVFAIATKAQAEANKQAILDYERYKHDPSNAKDYLGFVKTRYTVREANAAGSTIGDALNTGVMFQTYLDKTTKNIPKAPNPATQSKKKISGDPAKINAKKINVKDMEQQNDGSYKATKKEVSYASKVATAIDSAVRDGSLFAAFRVNYTGSVSESFSNSVGEIEAGGMLKSLSKKSRNMTFNLSGGNVMGDAVKTAIGYAKDTLFGGLDSVTYGLSNVIQTLIGGGYIDLPKKWEDSSMSLPQVSYNMQLISPYGNAFSQMQNIYIPLAMLLAGTLPLATGKASYTSPFICSLFSKGVQNIKLGMITSLTITRGTSNLAFNKDKRALALDVSFTVTDFSNIMSAPINASIFSSKFNVALDDDLPIANYVSVMAARNLLTNKYTLPKIKLRYSRMRMAYDQEISPSSWGMRIGESLNGVLGGFVSQRSLTKG